MINSGQLPELDVVTLYAILRLRSEIFVVEQECAFLDLDGRDLEPGTRFIWITDGAEIVASLRLLVEPNGVLRIGRVVVAANHRRSGHARELMREALRLAGDQELVLDSQSYLVGWYAGLGFAITGSNYIEDGIVHTPMKFVGL